MNESKETIDSLIEALEEIAPTLHAVHSVGDTLKITWKECLFWPCGRVATVITEAKGRG